MSIKITHQAMTARLSVTGAPVTTGTAGYSGKTRDVRPEIVTTTRGGERVVLNGPQVRADGSETVARFEVKVSLDDADRVAPAPQWVRDLVTEVWT